MVTKKGLGPRIDEKTETWLTENFDNKTVGAEYVLTAFPGLYRRALHGLKGRFSGGELSLMIDVSNAFAPNPTLAGLELDLQAEDAINLDQLDKKWDIPDAEDFLSRLNRCSIFESACLQIWALAFWRSGAYEKKNALQDYIKPLTEE